MQMLTPPTKTVSQLHIAAKTVSQLHVTPMTNFINYMYCPQDRIVTNVCAEIICAVNANKIKPEYAMP